MKLFEDSTSVKSKQKYTILLIAKKPYGMYNFWTMLNFNAIRIMNQIVTVIEPGIGKTVSKMGESSQLPCT